MAVREGAWDCPLCGHKRNRGPDKHCTKCGKPRDVSVPFYLPEDAVEVEAAEAHAGPDWTCTFCSHANGGASQFCGNCGVDRRDLAMTRKVTEVRTAPAAVAAVGASPKKGCLNCGLGCAMVLLGLLWLIWSARPVERTLQVSGHEWTRVVNTEVFRTVTEDAWEGEVPSGVRRRSSRREVHHVNQVPDGTTTRREVRQERVGTKKVKVGTRDLGNGYFEDITEDEPIYRSVTQTVREPRYRDEPVYRQKYYYDVEKWVSGPPAQASGRDLSPAWPRLSRDARERGRQETYRLLFSDGSVFETSNESEWRAHPDGQSVHASVSGSRVVEILP